jgi:hypothetical protein
MKLPPLVPVLFGAFAIVSTSFAACGTTPGRPITLQFFMQGDAADFDTTAGFHVHLTEAHLVVGPVYVLAPHTMTTQLERLLVPVAYAHGGHDDYASLQVRAEWLEQLAVDLLSPERVLLGTADGTAGPSEYTTLHLETPTGSNVEAVHGHEAWIAGTATPIAGGEPIAFEGGLDIPQDALGSVVEGIATTFTMDTGGELTITAHVRGQTGPLSSPSWLDQAHFERLAAPSSGTVREIVPGSQVHSAWLLAARNAEAFTTTYSQPSSTPGP